VGAIAKQVRIGQSARAPRPCHGGRLESLVHDGLLTRESDAANKSAAVYKPTETALALLPMLFELMRWGIVYNPNADTNGPVMLQLASDPEGLHSSILEKFRHRTRRRRM